MTTKDLSVISEQKFDYDRVLAINNTHPTMRGLAAINGHETDSVGVLTISKHETYYKLPSSVKKTEINTTT